MVHARPALLLATAYTSARTGHTASLGAILGEAEALLARGEVDAATTEAMRGEIDIFSLATLMAFEQDPPAALVVARRALDRIPPDRRLAFGFAQGCVGLALQATGETDAAVRWLTECVERDAERIDAGTIRVVQGLMFAHRQAGNFPQSEAVARELIVLSRRHELPVATGWGHLWLAWLAYEGDDLDLAIDHYLAVLADSRHAAFLCRFEAMVGLAIAYHGKGMEFEANNTAQRLREIVLGEDALEYLPTAAGLRGAPRAPARPDGRGDPLALRVGGRPRQSFPAYTRAPADDQGRRPARRGVRRQVSTWPGAPWRSCGRGRRRATTGRA